MRTRSEGSSRAAADRPGSPGRRVASPRVSTWLIVWLILLLVPLLFVVFVVGLGLRALNVGRAAGRFAKELGDLTGGIVREGERAASHQRGRRPGGRDRSSAGRR